MADEHSAVARAGARMGRPRLTERRKEQTRLDIAREAVALFSAHGVDATSADEIATAAGISVRTLWRYFPTKERCVQPLLTPGIDSIARALSEWDAGAGMAVLLDGFDRHCRAVTSDMPMLLTLARLTRTEPALRGVWLEVHADAEPVFAAEIARRAGQSSEAPSVHVQAALVAAALRVAVEQYAFRTTSETHDGAELIDEVRAALRTVDQRLAE
ncbi:TetR/AcrR family transcriptional regulator [Streptomyces capitiformicae]|uniref:TetR family transcriptional regulator n=1 Tax=Streptomyces capitiformicae TaxID=2014920 RepID=A0A919DFV9_9ACTN|nr:TetR/AcrR family transcriptional regulator [Streptomyces capitiformicae]GHE41775.1 TetR family transcriptional regulator [Streptomyces capitiformicae]